MQVFLSLCGLLPLLFSPAVPMCVPTDYTLYVERPECDYCVAINTTICVGFCYSWDSNIRDVRPHLVVQSRCTYDKVEYRTAILPGCPMDANPAFSYPVALSCHCSACKRDSDDCAHRPIKDRVGCTKPQRHVYPYLYQDNNMLPF